MKKTLLALFLLLPLTTMGQGLLEKYGRVLTDTKGYCAPRVKGRIVVDGKLNESDWKNAPHTDFFVDIEGEGRPLPKYKTTAQMLWDEDYFYVAATLEEPNVVARLKMRDTIIWKENDFEVFIDPDNDGVNYYEFEVNARNTMMDLMITHPYRSGGDFIMPWDCAGLKHAGRGQGTLNKSRDTDKGWTVEMAIPVRSLRKNFGYTQGLSAMEPEWRVNFSRVQWLKPEGPEENWVWSPTGKVDMHMPERWGRVNFVETLYDCAGGETSPEYQLAWALFYALQDYCIQYGHYTNDLAALGLTDADRHRIDSNAEIEVQATDAKFEVRVKLPYGQSVFVDERGRVTYPKLAEK